MVHFVYLIPSDRAHIPAYEQAILDAGHDFQSWLRSEMGSGKTFQLASSRPEVYVTPHTAAWYSNNNTHPNMGSFQFWYSALDDGVAATGARFGDPGNVWIFYIDAYAACGQHGGAGTNGIALMDANDIHGLAGEAYAPACPDEPPWNWGVCRWIGGLGHELGHAFGLPHPAGCESAGPAPCPINSLMWTGYASYPETYLLPTDVSTLEASAFLSVQLAGPWPSRCARPGAPEILIHPSSATVPAGRTATFRASATGMPAPSVQWWVSATGGSTWAPVEGATSPSYSFVASGTDTGKRFAAVFTNIGGSTTTHSAELATVVFTDDPIRAGVTSLKAAHLIELRSCIDALRTALALPAFSWTDSAVTARATTAKAAHVEDLRAALHDVFVTAAQSPPSYTDPVLVPGVTPVKALHINELRTAVVAAPDPAPDARVIGVNGDLAFGDVGVGLTATRTLTITNSGKTALTVDGIVYPKGFSGAWSGTLPAGGSQNVTVTFTPVAVGAYGGTAALIANQTNGTNTIPVSGSGVPSRVIALSGDLAFGYIYVGNSTSALLAITNTGSETITVSGMTIPAGFSVSSTSGTVWPGMTWYVVVGFAPTYPGYYTGTLTVVADHTSGTNSIAVSGIGSNWTPNFYSVWGWAEGSYSTYLGYIGCIFCQEPSANSINNPLGPYGGRTSGGIRDANSIWGSAVSPSSACSDSATNPPRVYNSSKTVYYGELTMNASRPEAMTSLLDWLRFDVCVR